MSALTPEKIKLKQALAHVVKGAGGFEAAAGFCRVGKSVLFDNTNPEKADSFAALDVLLDLEPLARTRPGWPHVTTFLAEQQGFTLVRVPEALPEGADLLALMADLGAAHGEVTSEVCKALADGIVVSAEAGKLRVLLRRERQIVMQLDTVLKAIEGGA